MVLKASNYEPWWRFKAEFLSPALSAHLWFNSRLRHNAFRKPGLRTFRLSRHFIVALQWDRNRDFTVHAECYIAHAFKAAIKLYTMLWPGMCRRGTNEATAPGIQGSGSFKEWNYKKCIYHNLVTRPGMKHCLWMLVAHTYKRWHTAFICMKYKR